jgi:K+-transporting ATPase ATPase C chain
MRSEFRPALVLLACLTLLTGIAYPLVVTGLAHTLMPDQAQGSLIVQDGKVLGSHLIGQCWDDPRWFWGRPSATGCNAPASSGSNLGPTNPVLREAVARRIARLRTADPTASGPVPIDLVTTSASGLDPDLSPEAVHFQVHRVAVARGMTDDALRALVDAHVQRRWLGLIGEAHVNILDLNLALQQRK